MVHGRKLFKDGKFDGNGRTCLTCHSLGTGTLSPVDAQARFIGAVASKDGAESDPLFRATDSDDGVGAQYDRLLLHATIRVAIDLPGDVNLESDPGARKVVVNRGIPSAIDSGLLDYIMQDGRAPDLETQALGAILGHAEAGRLPTAAELHEIADFERTLFSRPELAAYFQGGPPPELPQGTTPEEIRGRAFFVGNGLCARCHSGPMLNETSAAHKAGAGQRFESVGVSELNRMGNPVNTLPIRNTDGTTKRTRTPDAGLALIHNQPMKGLKFNGPVNFFRIPTLWNVKNTAPYFHDNSANTLEEMMEQYQAIFPNIKDQDKTDIIAYLKLL